MSTVFDPAANQFTTHTHHDTYEFIKSVTKDFSGRRVLITGASKGIGQAITIAFARAGYSHIALLARSSVAPTIAKARSAAQLAGRQSPEFLELSADLTSDASVRAAAAKVQSTFGFLDILVNNAGYLETWKLIDESDPDQWWRTWEVNVKGTYLVNRAFIPILLKGGEKTLVTVTSGGAWVTTPGGSAYQGSKTAQVRMNNHLMAEYGDQGMLAYAIHPGGVKTDLASGMPDRMKHILVDQPELAADTVVWLTQDKLSWLADRYVSVRWDMQELSARREEIVSRDLLKLNLSQ